MRANELDFHYLEQGQGTPVLLLHGFPDHAAAWRPLVAQLAPGFRLIAPDLRGYGRTARPSGNDAYRLDILIDDVAALLDALDLPSAVICGHDWGGVLGFAFAARHSERVSALIALNAPPPGVLQDMIWDDPAQRAASQYITMLRTPAADALFAETNVDALIERFLGDPYRHGLLNADDIAAYRTAWTLPGVWQAMLAWYRAAPFDVPAIGAEVTVRTACRDFAGRPACPVQLIWGDRDTVFVSAMPDRIAAACTTCRIDRVPSAGHVPHRDVPALCGALIADFLTSSLALSDAGDLA